MAWSEGAEGKNGSKNRKSASFFCVAHICPVHICPGEGSTISMWSVDGKEETPIAGFATNNQKLMKREDV